MVAYNIGSATTTVFSTTTIQDANASGAHTFKLWTDSVLYLAGGSFGFQAGGPGSSASWTIDIDGTLTGFANESSTNLADYGIRLNTPSATTLHKVNVGTEGSIFAEQIAINLNSAANVVNKGAIQANMDNSESIGIMFEANPTALGPTRAISVKNELTAELLAGQHAILNNSLATLTVTNAGTIINDLDFSASAGGAIVSHGTLKLTNNANSQIAGGIRSEWIASTVVNNGLLYDAIDGDIASVYIDGQGRIDLNRDGDWADTGESSIGGVNNQLGISVTNTGYILGSRGLLAEAGATGSDSVVGQNMVAFDGTEGRDSISNSSVAVIRGDLSMGAGNDTVNNAGLINGTVDTGDLASLAGDRSDTLNAADGNDTLSNAITGTITHSVFTGGGNDTVNNAGLVGGPVDLGAGDDRLINAGRILGTVMLGAGNDAATITGALGDTPSATGSRDLFGGDGDDTVLVGATGLVDDLFLGNGNDAVTINGRVDDVMLDRADSLDTSEGFGSVIADGNDRLFVTTTGQILGGRVYMGGGNNVLSNAGIIDADPIATTLAGGVDISIAFGSGADSLNNATTGRIDALSILMGAGNDTVVNAGRMFIDHGSSKTNPYIQLGAGDDRLTNTGTIGDNLGGSSNGSFFSETLGASANLYHSFLHNGMLGNPLNTYRVAVDAGDGADVVTATGRIFGLVDMGTGNDSFLGGVNNDFAIDGQGADTMNMGAGADYLYVRGQVNYEGGDTFVGGDGIDLIQFGSDGVNSGGVHIDLASGHINYELGADTLNAQDSIIGFEQVRGTDLADSILGGVGAETLDGGAGADTIAGRGGRDILLGNDGADQFVFFAATDSGKTRATRDVIIDFNVVEGDKIRFMFDGNGSAVSGSFDDELLENADFSGVAGQLRTIIQGGNTIVELDMNGDKRVDFAIELKGVVDLSYSDFLFS